MSKSSRMLHLSFMAYEDFWNPNVEHIEENVKKSLNNHQDTLGFESVEWGPVAFKNPNKMELFTDSLVYILKENEDEYTVAIRGTNPVSLSSWIFQDLDVAGMTPWSRQSPNSDNKKAYISKATDRSLGIHKNLTCKQKDGEITVLEWLVDTVNSRKSENSGNKITLNITGHSLGGLMCGVFAGYLMDELHDRSLRGDVDCKVYSYAGPSAGNRSFAEHLSSTIDEYNRFTNRHDIATLVWDESDVTSLPELYKTEDIEMNPKELSAFNYFKEEVTGLDYKQPLNPIDVKCYIASFFPTKEFLVQAAYQHAIPYLIWGCEQHISVEVKMVEHFLNILKHLISHPHIGEVFKGLEDEFLNHSKNKLMGCITDRTS